MSKLIYCQKKTGNRSHCACPAEYKVTLITKKNQLNGETRNEYRCEKHKASGTNKKCVVSSSEEKIDQSEYLLQIKTDLQFYIGKEIFSSMHRNAHPFIGRYVKDYGIMCNPNNNKNVWKYVYYDQIIKIN